MKLDLVSFERSFTTPVAAKHGVVREINTLIFQRTPEPFNKNCPSNALAIHRDFNRMIFKDVGKRQACILTSLIRVENIGDPIQLDGAR